MLRFCCLILVFALNTTAVRAGNIQYGYNARGEWVPVSVDGERIEYGYNARGDYVPTAVGNNRIDY